MEYVTPNTTVLLMKNVPLDADYEHTIYFESPDQQFPYFNNLVTKRLLANSYQRAGRGAIRVAATMAEIYNCNYMCFYNISHEDKIYYAFITSVEYVNEQASLVHYTIDVMQTWLFDYTIGPSFVEREHWLTDNPGDNLVPENVELGDYVVDNDSEESSLEQVYIVMAATVKLDGADVVDAEGDIRGGVYSGLYYTYYPANSSGAALLSEHIKLITLAGKADGIVSIFMCPGLATVNANEVVPGSKQVLKVKPTTLGSYTPKNKKLLTAPYNQLYVTDGNGHAATYDYEQFTFTDNETASFQLYSSISTITDAVLVPRYYKGSDNLNWDESFTINGWAQCSYNVDSFKAWMAQNSATLAAGFAAGITQVAQGAGLLASGGLPALYGTAVGSAASQEPLYQGGVSIAKQIAQIYDRSKLPPVSKGTTSNITRTALGAVNFHYYQKHIQPQFAKIIDDYFTMYGYATNRLKVPNRAGRPHWNYTKVANLQTITSRVPADDMAQIRAIYANGITWWRNGSEVGNYFLDNSIVNN